MLKENPNSDQEQEPSHQSNMRKLLELLEPGSEEALFIAESIREEQELRENDSKFQQIRDEAVKIFETIGLRYSERQQDKATFSFEIEEPEDINKEELINSCYEFSRFVAEKYNLEVSFLAIRDTRTFDVLIGDEARVAIYANEISALASIVDKENVLLQGHSHPDNTSFSSIDVENFVNSLVFDEQYLFLKDYILRIIKLGDAQEIKDFVSSLPKPNGERSFYLASAKVLANQLKKSDQETEIDKKITEAIKIRIEVVKSMLQTSE